MFLVRDAGPKTCFPFSEKLKLWRRGGIEPPLKALQAFAFPLGDRAAELISFATDRNQILAA
jgi:hypothetical protein